MIKKPKTTWSYKNFLLPGICILIIITGLSYLQYHSDINTPLDPSDNTEISFQIKKGQPVKEIAKNLSEKELINSALAFYWYAKWHNLGENIIAGRFILNKTMNVPQILKTISDPSQAEFIITIQEGLTIKDIEQKLIDLDLVGKGEFLREIKNFSGWQYYTFLDKEKLKSLILPLEGYLYPDTYFLDPAEFKPHDLIYLALDNFEKKIADLNFSAAKKNIHEIITMASIIENEVFSEKDRKIVSGILWKRLENRWPLGADATILYVTDDRTISEEDLKTDSKYNTRKYAGLPPGPICSPSIESIKAALSPTPSDYWFYLTTKAGEVIYSKTNEEHNTNREKYL